MTGAALMAQRATQQVTPSAALEWVSHEVRGQRWLSARFSIEPLWLPAFSVIGARVESERVRLMRGAYRAQPELVEGGVLPEWVLLLGAMGLHVYGMGHEIVAQDREGRTCVHDEYRLRLIAQFIQEQVSQSPGLECPRDSDSAFANEVRERLCAGTWDLPAAEPPPWADGIGPTVQDKPLDLRRASCPDLQPRTRQQAFHEARRREQTPSVGAARRARPQDPDGELGWRRPRTDTSRALWQRLQRTGELVDGFGV
jgi:hypothetical protein